MHNKMLSLGKGRVAKGFNAYDKAEDQNTVNEVLNKLAQKLFYTANDGRLAGTVKIAEGLTASSESLKTGDISFSTDATGTKTLGQGFVSLPSWPGRLRSSARPERPSTESSDRSIVEAWLQPGSYRPR